MGVNQGSVLLFALGGLTFYHLCSVCRERSKDSDRPGAPAVVGDVSWLCHLYIKKKSVEETVAIVTSIIEKFVEEEVSFYAAFDPDDGRRYTKKASTVREVRRQESIQACLAAKSKIMVEAKRLREEATLNDQQKNIIREKLKQLEKDVKKGEMALEEMQKHPKIVAAVRSASFQSFSKQQMSAKIRGAKR